MSKIDKEQASKEVKSNSGFSVELFKNVLPKSHRTMVTEELIDRINQMGENQALAESFRDNLIGYTTILKDGKFKLEDYVNAVRFVSYKLLNNTDLDAYIKTFPDRFQRLLDDGVSRDDVAAYAWAYKKNKLVILITEQTLVPTHVLNSPLHQEAINVAASMMYSARSEMVRLKAAETVIMATKPPENTKIALEVGFNEETRNSQQHIADQFAALAIQQQALLARGYTISEVQKLNLARPGAVEDAIFEEDEDE